MPRKFEREAATTPLRSCNKIRPKFPDAVAARTLQTRKPLIEFAACLTIGKNVILRLNMEERYGNPNDVYFVEQMVERAQKLCDPRRYSSTKFPMNDWIVKICWYALSSIASTGNCIYDKWGYSQYICCSTIVRSFTRDVTLVQTGLQCSLSRDLYEHICSFGDITV